MRRAVWLGLLAAWLALGLAACAGAPAAAPEGTPAVTLSISAERSIFDQDSVVVPAGAPFAVHFENRDTVPHNVSIRGNGTAQVGEIFGGPAERTYHFAALEAGSYTFICDVHPEMRGTVESRAIGSSER